eukprot:856840-Rhodomonas_salina.1
MSSLSQPTCAERAAVVTPYRAPRLGAPVLRAQLFARVAPVRRQLLRLLHVPLRRAMLLVDRPWAQACASCQGPRGCQHVVRRRRREAGGGGGSVGGGAVGDGRRRK